MLIFGASVSDWQEKAAYALDKADNDFAEVHEVRCEDIEDVKTAFAAMAAFALDGNCKKFLYHATINLEPKERLTREQWQHAVDTLEKNLRLENHYRVVFEHIKHDRQHYHIVWSRVPPEGGPAIVMSNNYYIHKKTAASLEREFGLKMAPRAKKDKPEDKRNSKTRVDPDHVTKEVTQIFKTSKTTQEFVKNLANAGYILCRGKNNSLVLVDKQGGYHGLMRRIDGAKIKDLRQKFPDLEKMQLPPLNAVLRMRRPTPMQGFRNAARYSTLRVPRVSGPRHKPINYRLPKSMSIEGIIAHYRRTHADEQQKKYYPLPIMRKRKRRQDLNEPARPAFNTIEMQNAELLAWAWENKDFSILATFGINLPHDYFDP